ncbi:MAG: ATP-binding protein [Fimbriimonadaceae bacterium]
MRKRDLLDLFDLSFASEEGLDAFLTRVLGRCATWFSASGGSIFLREGDILFRIAAQAGVEARVDHCASIQPGVGVAGMCIESKEPLLVNDPDQHPLLAGKLAYRRRQAFTAMVVPLIVPNGEVLGVLNVSRPFESEPFNDQDLRLANTLGKNIALAVSNAMLVERLSESLQNLKELERVRRLAEIGQMTAAVAHEIRNPLASIRSAAQLVQQDPRSAVEFGEIIEAEALKLNALCDEFLAFARPIELDLKPLRLNALVTSVANSHAAEFEREGVVIRVESDPGDPIIIGDSDRLEQVCRNLLINALQATSSGGSVRVVVDGASFSVEDDGQGIGPEASERLFTPFFTTKPKGTGLGLSNVKRIVDAHRGHIEVTSEPRSGSKFEVSLEPRSA